MTCTKQTTSGRSTTISGSTSGRRRARVARSAISPFPACTSSCSCAALTSCTRSTRAGWRRSRQREAGAMGLDSSRDGCGGAANSWGGRGGEAALDLNLRHSAGKRQFPGSCVRPLVYVRCMTVRARTAALLCVRRELYMYMYMYSVFFTRKASLVPRLLRPTAPLRTLRLVTCVFNRLSRALASREAAICKSSNENESHNVTKQSTQCIASHLPQL